MSWPHWSENGRASALSATIKMVDAMTYRAAADASTTHASSSAPTSPRTPRRWLEPSVNCVVSAWGTAADIAAFRRLRKNRSSVEARRAQASVYGASGPPADSLRSHYISADARQAPRVSRGAAQYYGRRPQVKIEVSA